MEYTNINILDGDRRFRYIIEYVNNAESNVSDNLCYVIGDEHVINDKLRCDMFQTGLERFRRFNNYWEKYDGEVIDVNTQGNCLPEHYNLSSVNIYFPDSSVETYDNNNLYMLAVNTWVHGHIVYLGTYLLDRRSALACKRETKFINRQYHEYINVKFLDPWHLIYSDEWKEFRQHVCGETTVDGHEQNNTGSVLNFTLYPVVENTEGQYVKLDPYIGGQNAINIADSISDYIGCDIAIVPREDELRVDDKELCVHASVHFNKSYQEGSNQVIQDLNQYMKETYGVDGSFRIDYSLVVLDSDNIYKIITKHRDLLDCTFTREEIAFGDWDGFKEGLKFSLDVSLYQENEGEREDYMILHSNQISITQDVMKYFIDTLRNENAPFVPKTINLDLVDMNNYTINAVNKVEKKIIQVDRPDDNKANLIKPAYFRARELKELTIHPAVTENICLNLDAYKARTTRFYLQIEGATFTEYSRIPSGVIFKIVGANLPNETGEGVCYLLNQDKELITTGKYKYES